MIKPFSGTPIRTAGFDTSDMTGDFGVEGPLFSTFASSLSAWLHKPNLDGDTIEGLLPMYTFASSEGAATSSSGT